jgi:hypothetical protein
MMRHPIILLALLCFLLEAAPDATAHRLVPDDGTHVDAESAIAIEDMSVSEVVYHEVTTDSAVLWATFSAEEGQDLYAQIAVPVIEGLEDYRPALALLGPGLPSVELPFDVPEGVGGIVLSTAGASPEVFDEHFTGTQSWILLEHNEEAPETGQYYLVAYHPDGQLGKLWVSWGKAEVFGLQDLLTYPDTVAYVRAFHEVSDEPLPLLPRVMSALSRLLQSVFRLLPFEPYSA